MKDVNDKVALDGFTVIGCMLQNTLSLTQIN